MAAASAGHHGSDATGAQERLELQGGARSLSALFLLAGLAGLVGAVVVGFFSGDHLRRFLFGYLTAYAFALSVALGALFFVLIQHLTRAAWSVSVRRIAEDLAATMPILGVLAIPIIASVLIQNGDLYRWALPYSSATPAAIKAAAAGEDEIDGVAIPEKPVAQAEKVMPGREGEAQDAEVHRKELDPILLQKRAMLNPYFFTVAIIACFLIWSAQAAWYRNLSVEQDRTGDPNLTLRMQKRAAPATVIFGLTLTLAAWLLLMSLDPHWYSTMYAVYYFAGCVVAFFSTTILVCYFLQKAGYLTKSVSIEHYHDLGKFLFAFVFFYGYVAFSQYMLLWYANIPETTPWFARRGATSAHTGEFTTNGWTWVAFAVLFGKFLIPFAGIISRHVKRKPGLLAFWAAWLLVFHFVDLYWNVLPEYGGSRFNLLDILALVGVCGIMLFGFFRTAATQPLRPTHDPRLADSLAFQNI